MNKILFASLIAVSPLLADTCCPPTIDSCTCCPGPDNARVDIRTTQPGGIGYPRGYTSIDLFYAPGSNPNFHPFLDFRAHVFNDGKPAFNTGLGLRYLPDCSEMVWGVNAYWDFRDAKHTSFNQVGLGFEALWANWDLRLNGYAPFNRHKKAYREGFLKFQGNSAIFYKKYELAMWGGDLDLGWMFYQNSCLDMHATLGGYYFQGDYGKHAGGGLLRVSSNMSDYFTAAGQVSYDNLFKWVGQGEIAINFPFGKTVTRSQRKIRCCDDLIAVEKRLVEKPQRFEIIPTTSHKKRGQAIDPTTGQPIRFIFVDNTSHSAGTFESPYPTLAQAVAASAVGDVIYIFPGNGTSTGLTTSTTLQDRQGLIGSGAAVEMLTRFGTLQIPQLSSTLPTIVTSGDTVTVANGNTISGLSITSTAGRCITGTPNGFILLKSALTGSTAPSTFNPSRGNLTITDNQFNVQGVSVTAGQDAVINVSRNLFSGNANSGDLINVRAANQSSVLATIESNVINNNFNFNGGAITATSQDSATLNASIRNNIVNLPSVTPGFGLNASSTTTSKAYFAIENNRVNMPGSLVLAVLVNSQNSSQLVARLVGNQSNAPTGGSFAGFSADAYTIARSGGTLTLESPNLALTGVQNVNTGHITQTGTVQFIQMQ